MASKQIAVESIGTDVELNVIHPQVVPAETVVLTLSFQSYAKRIESLKLSFGAEELRAILEGSPTQWDWYMRERGSGIPLWGSTTGRVLNLHGLVLAECYVSIFNLDDNYWRAFGRPYRTREQYSHWLRGSSLQRLEKLKSAGGILIDVDPTRFRSDWPLMVFRVNSRDLLEEVIRHYHAFRDVNLAKPI